MLGLYRVERWMIVRDDKFGKKKMERNARVQVNEGRLKGLMGLQKVC